MFGKTAPFSGIKTIRENRLPAVSGGKARRSAKNCVGLPEREQQLYA